VVAIEQNNNYIEFGEKVFGQRCAEANPSAKRTALAAGTVGRSLLDDLPACDRTAQTRSG
jgi:hypothetical protein